MAPSPLTPISEESLPNYPEIKVNKENKTNFTMENNNNNNKEDQGCLFFYDRPEAKGSFHEDSFFKDAQKNYESAVQDILNRRVSNNNITSNNSTSNNSTNNNSTSNSNINSTSAVPSKLSTYRHLRQADSKQDTQASGLTDLGLQYQIVLDVTSYSPTDITVKAVGDRELLVEGRRVDQRQDGTSVNQSFTRRFCLPGLVQLDAVTSALSSDGVLTVTAPKISNPAAHITTSATTQPLLPPKQDYVQSSNLLNNSRVQDDVSKSSHGIQNSIFDEKDNIYTEEFGNFLNDVNLENRMKYQMGFGDELDSMMMPSDTRKSSASSDMVEEDQHFKITLDTSGYVPKDISVKAVGERELLVEGKRVEKNAAGAETSQSFSRRFCLPELVKLESVTSSLSPEGVLTITAPKIVVNSAPKIQGHQGKQNIFNSSNNLQNSNSSTQFSSVNDNNSQYHRDAIDDFFGKEFDMGINCYRRPNLFMEQARNDYNESMQNMMNGNYFMEPEVPSFFSVPSAFRTMEKPSAKSASDIIESADDYKMKLDVSQYKPEEISVKAVGEKELLIEGKHEGKKDQSDVAGPAITRSFTRRFCLPGLVHLDAVTSSLSSDGTLTISAPKMMTTQ